MAFFLSYCRLCNRLTWTDVKHFKIYTMIKVMWYYRSRVGPNAGVFLCDTEIKIDSDYVWNTYCKWVQKKVEPNNFHRPDCLGHVNWNDFIIIISHNFIHTQCFCFRYFSPKSTSFCIDKKRPTDERYIYSKENEYRKMM